MELADNRKRDPFGSNRTEVDTHGLANSGSKLMRRRAQFLGKSIAPRQWAK